MNKEYLSAWRLTMAKMLATKKGIEDYKPLLKCFETISPTSEAAGISVAERFMLVDETVVDRCLTQEMLTNSLDVEPRLLPAFEIGNGYKGSQAVHLFSSAYLYLNDNGVLILKSFDKGIAPIITPVSILDDLSHLKTTEDRLAAVYAHVAFMCLYTRERESHIVAKLLEQMPATLFDFAKSVLVATGTQKSVTCIPFQQFWHTIRAIVNLPEIKRIPIFDEDVRPVRGGKSEGRATLLGEVVIYHGAIGYKRAREKTVKGYYIKSQTKEAYRVCLLLLTYFMGLQGAWETSVYHHTADGKPLSEDLKEYFDTIKKGDKFANISRAYDYINANM